MVSTLALAFLAGILSTLSPCVLPLIPLVLGAPVSEHRLGPLALAAGLAASFTVVGLFVATLGYAIGFNGNLFRLAGAALMISVGVVLLVPRFQARLAMASGPVGNWADGLFGTDRKAGLSGQFLVGMLLGVVWSPCVGPTLGAASVLAAKGQNLGQVGATMLTFGIGAALPLLALGLLSRETMLRIRGRLMMAGYGGKIVLGLLLVVLGLAIAMGIDKRLEAAIVDLSPEWLTTLTTHF